jgi:hypothetical protein
LTDSARQAAAMSRELFSPSRLADQLKTQLQELLTAQSRGKGHNGSL